MEGRQVETGGAHTAAQRAVEQVVGSPRTKVAHKRNLISSRNRPALIFLPCLVSGCQPPWGACVNVLMAFRAQLQGPRVGMLPTAYGSETSFTEGPMQAGDLQTNLGKKPKPEADD